jgi:hypothetical protein
MNIFTFLTFMSGMVALQVISKKNIVSAAVVTPELV